MKTIALASLCALLFLTACDKANENNGGNGQKPDTEVTATVIYEVDGGEDTTAVIDITAHYLDADGKEVTVGIEEFPWQATVENVTLPFTAKIWLEKSKVQGYKPEWTFDIGIAATISYTTSDGREVSNHKRPSTTVEIGSLDSVRSRIIKEDHSETAIIE